MDLSIRWLGNDTSSVVKLPVDATVDHLIAQLCASEHDDESVPHGCAGFLVTPKKRAPNHDYYDDYDPVETPASDLPEKLMVNGGTLLVSGSTLSHYGLNATTCKEVTLYPIFEQAEKQPTVFRSDIRAYGFGDGAKVYEYVKLNKEDKEIVAARGYFGVVLPWLQGESHRGRAAVGDNEGELKQSISFSMQDDFTEVPKIILTVHISQVDGQLNVNCTNLAGNSVCSMKVARGETAAGFRSSLCESLQWPALILYDGADRISEARQLSQYSLLTAEQVTTREHIHGVYQRYESSVRPAGYSASGESLLNMLILETDKAGLLYYFKGDYKRAEELRKIVMTNARWSIGTAEDGKHVVQIVGEAVLNRYHVHERCGPDGTKPPPKVADVRDDSD